MNTFKTIFPQHTETENEHWKKKSKKKKKILLSHQALPRFSSIYVVRFSKCSIRHSPLVACLHFPFILVFHRNYEFYSNKNRAFSFGDSLLETIFTDFKDLWEENMFILDRSWYFSMSHRNLSKSFFLQKQNKLEEWRLSNLKLINCTGFLEDFLKNAA